MPPQMSDRWKQARTNEALACRVKNMTIQSTKRKCRDWAITMFFYGALHYVQSVLDEVSNVSKWDHKIRESEMLKVKELRTLVPLYNTLYNRSRQARYDCEEFEPTDVEDALNKYLKVREKVTDYHRARGREIPGVS